MKTPDCPKCESNSKVFPDDKKKVTPNRFWRCFECNTYFKVGIVGK